MRTSTRSCTFSMLAAPGTTDSSCRSIKESAGNNKSELRPGKTSVGRRGLIACIWGHNQSGTKRSRSEDQQLYLRPCRLGNSTRRKSYVDQSRRPTAHRDQHSEALRLATSGHQRPFFLYLRHAGRIRVLLQDSSKNDRQSCRQMT